MCIYILWCKGCFFSFLPFSLPYFFLTADYFNAKFFIRCIFFKRSLTDWKGAELHKLNNSQRLKPEEGGTPWGKGSDQVKPSLSMSKGLWRPWICILMSAKETGNKGQVLPEVGILTENFIKMRWQRPYPSVEAWVLNKPHTKGMACLVLWQAKEESSLIQNQCLTMGSGRIFNFL